MLDVLGAFGDYTTAFNCVFGHVDNVGQNSPPFLKSKVTLPLLEVDTTVKLDTYVQSGRVPPAGLAYPSYKVATVSFGASDVELHCLHSEVHLGTQQDLSSEVRYKRGSWTRCGGSYRFSPVGAAITGWNRGVDREAASKNKKNDKGDGNRAHEKQKT